LLSLRIVGWVKRDTGTIFVGFAYLDAPQNYDIVTRLANPTRLVEDYGLTQPTILILSYPRYRFPMADCQFQ
jgi:hypothetical protein